MRVKFGAPLHLIAGKKKKKKESLLLKTTEKLDLRSGRTKAKILYGKEEDLEK